jgi:hypothetical protein
MNLEDELKLALRRKQPPPGFRERVLRQAESSPYVRRSRRWSYRNVAAAVLLTAILGGTGAHYIEQRREGEHAKEQMLEALRITSHTLRDTREHIHQLSK